MTSVARAVPLEFDPAPEFVAPRPRLFPVPDVVDAAAKADLLVDSVAWQAAPGWQIAAKRVVDVIVATILLILTLPVMLVAAMAIKFEDRGPVLFRQERVGRDGRRLMVYKFRTMVTDAEEQLPLLLAQNVRQGPLFKLGNDPRVTRVGRFMRIVSIDELPQLVAVLQGTMSMVGPRPALPSEVAQFDSALLDRLRVQPGITGLWQVEARDDPSFESYRRYDLQYVRNWSLWLDLRILGSTVTSVLGRASRACLSRSDKATSIVLD